MSRKIAGMRSQIAASDQGERLFRWRGREVSRVENLSDIVFAMALTLIAASSVPSNFEELLGLWREICAMAFAFALLLILWRSHYVFFRRYDLEDARTSLINAVLLFLVMAFAYPLKFLALFIVDLLTLSVTGRFDEVSAILSADQARGLTAIYSAGYAAVFGVFALLYAHAASRADALGLTKAERILTRLEIQASLIHVVVALLAALIAALAGDAGVWAGMVYFVVGPLLGFIMNRGSARAQAAAEAETVSESALESGSDELA